jgi:anti-sigma factor RsiW
MNQDKHQRAAQLLRAARIEGIPSPDEQWLRSHLSDCAACAREEKTLADAIDGFRGVRVAADPEMVRRTSILVRRRAEELKVKRERAIPLWISAAMSAVLVMFTTPLVWSALEWFGRATHVPELAWQFAFLTWWFLPATILTAAAGWQLTTHLRENWGRS